MKTRFWASLVLLGLLCGCSSGTRMAHDQSFASKVLSCAYDGSFAPVRSSFHRYYLRQTPDWITAAMGELLKRKYGEVRGVLFLSMDDLNRGAVASIWGVKAEKASYQMKIVFAQSGEVLYLAFRSSDKDTWKPAAQMARDYIREQTTKPPQ